MTLRNGKFYDDAGNVVPLEFGNKDQFSILQRADKWITEPEEVDTDYHFNKNGDCTGYHHEWWCLCGNNVRANNHRDMPGRKYKCKECGNRFEIEAGEFGEIVVRLIKTVSK